MPTNFSQHPTVPFPAFLRIMGFRDASWKNDSMPRAAAHIPGTNDIVSVWVNYPDGERETDADAAYVVTRGADDPTELYSGDDPAAVIRCARAILSAR